jgi:hypothetical protein
LRTDHRELREFARLEFGQFKTPHSVTSVKGLPKNATGKRRRDSHDFLIRLDPTRHQCARLLLRFDHVASVATAAVTILLVASRLLQRKVKIAICLNFYRNNADRFIVHAQLAT